MPVRKPFCIVVSDRDRNVFSVHGPMTDDREITNQVVEAQESGRAVNCSTSSADSVEEAAASYASAYPMFRRVAAALHRK
jgi:hypothetical protein